MELDDGGAYEASAKQRQLWSDWLGFWEGVKHRARRENAKKITALVVGDSVDKNSHDGSQLITTNDARILDIGEAALETPLKVADEMYIFRGTAAHTGGAGKLEEMLAKRLGTKGPSHNIYSWWSAVLEFQGVQFDVTHHPATNSTRPWLRGSAAMRQSAIIESEHGIIPAVALRGHVHHFEDSGLNFYVRTFFLDPWKLRDAYELRLGFSQNKARVGGLIFVCRDYQYTVERVDYEVR